MKNLLIMTAVICAPAGAMASKIDGSLKAQVKNDQANANSQGKVSKTAEQTRTLLDEYRIVLKKIDNTKVYNNQLRVLIASQKEEAVSIEEQIKTLKETNKEIVPLMLRMIESLEKFVELDVPFLEAERADRIANLRRMMDRADVSTSEKYRRVLEAFQVENEYGRTIEAYRGSKKVGDKDLNVDFLRVGRVALIYQTPDRDFSGVWDQKSRKWTDLPGGFDKSVQEGIRIARKQAAPNLIKLPIAAPEVSK